MKIKNIIGEEQHEISAIARTICTAVTNAQGLDADRLLVIVEEDGDKGETYIGIRYK